MSTIPPSTTTTTVTPPDTEELDRSMDDLRDQQIRDAGEQMQQEFRERTYNELVDQLMFRHRMQHEALPLPGDILKAS